MGSGSIAFACYWSESLGGKWVGEDCPKGGDINKKLDKTGSVMKQPGVVSETAVNRLRETEREMDTRVNAGRNEVAHTPANGVCTGSGCTSTPEMAATAENRANDIARAANTRLDDALQRRREIYGDVDRGVQAGRYSSEQARDLRDAFNNGKRPSIDDIQAMAKPIQDPAHALRANAAEIDYLKAVKEEYAQVAEGAHELRQRLDAVALKAKAIAGGQAKMLGKNSGSTLQAGEGSSSGGKGSATDSEGKNPSASAEFPFSARSLNPPGSSHAKAGTSTSEAARIEKDLAAKNGEGNKKTMSEADKTVLAGMLKELQADLSKNDKDGSTSGAGSNAGAPTGSMAELAKEELKKQSLLGGAILSISREAVLEPERRPASRNLMGQLRAELDYLNVDTDLFKRVRECIRRNSQKEIGN